MSLKLLIKGNFLSHPFSLATFKHSSNDPAISRQNVSLLMKNLYISTVYCYKCKKFYRKINSEAVYHPSEQEFTLNKPHTQGNP